MVASASVTNSVERRMVSPFGAREARVPSYELENTEIRTSASRDFRLPRLGCLACVIVREAQPAP